MRLLNQDAKLRKVMKRIENKSMHQLTCPNHTEDSAQGVTDVTTICLNADNY